MRQTKFRTGWGLVSERERLWTWAPRVIARYSIGQCDPRPLNRSVLRQSRVGRVRLKFEWKPAGFLTDCQKIIIWRSRIILLAMCSALTGSYAQTLRRSLDGAESDCRCLWYDFAPYRTQSHTVASVSSCTQSGRTTSGLHFKLTSSWYRKL